MPALVHCSAMTFIKKYLNILFLILYAVGILGFQIDSLQPLFLTLVPSFLLLSAMLLLSQHPSWSPKFIYWVIGVVLFGIGIEWLGVKTSAIFGTYSYGETLGWRIDGIPLIIGVNWLILAYCSKDIADRIFNHPFLSILLASVLMVFLDFFIEPVAIQLEFWYWPENVVPIQNYVGWFIASLFLFSVSTPLKLHWKNQSSVILYLCMLVFFAALNFYA